VTVRRSVLAPSGLGGEESDLQNAPSVSHVRKKFLDTFYTNHVYIHTQENVNMKI